MLVGKSQQMILVLLPVSSRLHDRVVGKVFQIQPDFDENQLFQIVEEMPEFPGGMGACLKFLMANTEYPEKAKAQKVEGKVSVKFVVEKDGSISNPQIIKGGNPLLNDEALRVVNSMPKWKPGKQRGKVVRVGYTVPIIFKLQ